MEKPTIYVVTVGEYSSYSICDVFTDRALAEKYVSLYGGEIEEFEANPYQQELKENLIHYYVSMKKDGTVDHVTKSTPVRRELSYSIYSSSYPYTEDGLILHVGVTTDSQERAIKIANEIRTQILAMNAWVKGCCGNDNIDLSLYR